MGIISILFGNYKTCDYDSKTTELKCNKCGKTEVEWYNDQPGDPHFCGGRFIRVKK